MTKDEELKEYAFDTATYENGKYKLLLSKSAKAKVDAGSFFSLLSDEEKSYVENLLKRPTRKKA